MGCSQSSPPEVQAAKVTNEKINKDLKSFKKEFEQEIRLLLLGAGESGKSTIVKQMRIIYAGGFDESERRQLAKPIKEGVLVCIRVLGEAMADLGIQYEKPSNAELMASFQNIPLNCDSFPPDFYEHVAEVWGDAGVRKAVARSNEFQLNDSATYFFEQVRVVGSPDYVPTEHDVLRLRVQTTGIVETKFVANDVQFHLFDVGGQRSERRKWIQCFGDVTGILFLVSSSAFDQVLAEDFQQNRLQEALELFASIWKNRWLESVSVIIFLNKVDLLEQKLRAGHKIADYFPQYAGGQDLEDAKDFLLKSFVDVAEEMEQKQMYVHFTVATDTENVLKVFMSVQDVIRQWHLREFKLV